ncbi:MAG: TPM domain-containing protein [Lachnospiraceae bacterium]|nr:TPM domain-containing protein [bacterium]MDY5518013.1 TPM domain-containing protein [Lachnospiraceae bacterium]
MKMRKNIHKVGTFVLSLLIMLAVLSPLNLKAADELAFLVDEAGLLSAEEAADIESKLSGLAQKYDMHYVIVTSEDPNISSPMAAADDFFDYNGYGTGEDRSGVLLYINMETRDVWISTRGFGITAFTDAGIDYILDELADGLGSELYYDTFEAYIARCDDFTLQAKNGTPYDVDHMPQEPFPFIGGLIMCMALGAVVALIYILVLRGQLKSVAPNESAIDYMKKGSMHVTNSREFFLYRTVSRTERPKENTSSSGGGGSTTHVSSSGATHGGGGRKF